ncbi:VRR-NUC domain-containing protein [Photobacterium sp. 1_MG-2023]|uniref:VRR-NUC domain-containing protein n=1 Tax=Photobacterium sp. 1_MG-2023 TaxID=3062646 RepID=UPI0026E19CC3|nr:VRR-NUC domain-containing protein [Photobacterium sp. 1_MG-2023]MDO6705640.1 VRR-NUC domain-containing protein [Photobacterium sp. 1_MG-2023]
MTQATSPELAPDYYRQNFEILLEEVDRQYQDLLSQAERRWMADYHELPDCAKLLYIRLLSRKSLFFRVSRLNYPEIDTVRQAIVSLLHSGFISQSQANWPKESLLNLFTKPELLASFDACSYPALWQAYPALRQLKKAALVEAIVCQIPDCLSLNDTLIRVEHQRHLTTFLLLFFGNQYQDLSQFVLADLGLHRFEAYQTDTNTRLFQQRHHIVQWLQLETLAQHYDTIAAAKQPDAMAAFAKTLPPASDWPPLERHRQRLLNRVARDLERCGRFDLALYLFSRSALPPSRERQVRILIQFNRPQTALAICQSMRQQPHHEEELEIAERLKLKLNRMLKRPAQPAAREQFCEETLHLPATGLRVELAVVAHYQQQGWTVHYTENALLCALFGLAFWDIIFSPVSGAFLNPFQRAPRDMYHPEFKTRREAMLTSRLEAIRTGQWQEWLTVFHHKQGITNDWVNWALVSPELITNTLACLTPEHRHTILSRLLFDPRQNRSGQPDLILLKNGQLRWVEVKGPGDTLQANQKRWLRLFQQCGLDARINHVVWQM